MARAATHYGHCQVCGRRQMLPGGFIAKHGYQVKDRGQGGYFVGTCKGSGHVPYQIGHYALDRDIEDATAYAAGMPDRIAAVLADDSLTVSVTFQRRAWDFPELVTGEVVLTGEEYFTERFGLMCEKTGKVRTLRNNSTGASLLKTPLDFVRNYRRGVAAGMQRQLDGLRLHIEDQKKRRAEWKPEQPLIPVRGR